MEVCQESRSGVGVCRQWSGKLTLSLPTTARTSCLPGSPRLGSSLKFRGRGRLRVRSLSHPFQTIHHPDPRNRNLPQFPALSVFAFPTLLSVSRSLDHSPKPTSSTPSSSSSFLLSSQLPPSSQPSSLPELVTSTGSGGVSSFFLLAGLDFGLERSL